MSVAAEPSVSLSERELERLHDVLLAGLAVRRRSHFFLWAQGQVQSLVPHQLLLCAHGDPARPALRHDHFAGAPVSDEDVARFVEPDSGLAATAVRAWQEGGGRPLVIGAAGGEPALRRRFESLLFRQGWQALAVHGTPSLPGEPASFFVFGGLPQPLPPRLGHSLELLLPQIHVAWLRVLAGESAEANAPPPAERVITGREVEILRWVRDGKSNQEIGDILGISPLTVKNHVQKILRKLKVQNRAQAVARGIALHLIRSGGGH